MKKPTARSRKQTRQMLRLIQGAMVDALPLFIGPIVERMLGDMMTAVDVAQSVGYNGA